MLFIRQQALRPVFTALILILLMVFPVAGAQPVTFQYSHTEGDQWHLTSEVKESVLADGRLLYDTEILNKIVVEVREGSGAEGRLWNRYHIAEIAPGSNVYAWSGEFEVEYNRNVQGALSGLPAASVVPTVRNIPVFPAEPVEKGAVWQEKGTEVFDLEPGHGIPEIVEIDFTADYQYTGTEIVDGRPFEVVEITYHYSWNPDNAMLRRFLPYAVFPWNISGEFEQKILWDSRAGRNYAEEGRFSYTYLMNDGHTYTYQGTSRGRAVYAEPLDKDLLVEEVGELEQEDIRAEVVPDGVKVSLDNINFYPDEAVMLPRQDEKLRGIMEILSRYPSRDIRVVGHTAYIPGLGDGQVLSEQRAETVARYIIDAGVRARENVVIRGMGNREPVADNSTEQGRRQNRRVEIVILEN